MVVQFLTYEQCIAEHLYLFEQHQCRGSGHRGIQRHEEWGGGAAPARFAFGESPWREPRTRLVDLRGRDSWTIRRHWGFTVCHDRLRPPRHVLMLFPVSTQFYSLISVIGWFASNPYLRMGFTFSRWELAKLLGQREPCCFKTWCQLQDHSEMNNIINGFIVALQWGQVRLTWSIFWIIT